MTQPNSVTLKRGAEGCMCINSKYGYACCHFPIECIYAATRETRKRYELKKWPIVLHISLRFLFLTTTKTGNRFDKINVNN